MNETNNDFNDVLIIDIETNSLDVSKARAVWFGCYSLKTNETHLLEFEPNILKIRKIVSDHSVIVGFNIKAFDMPVLSKCGVHISKYDYFIVDLLEVCRPGSVAFAGKGRLSALSIKPNNYSLKTIIETLKLDDSGKDEIDYDIFKKNKLTSKEIKKIKKYLKKDVEITYKLYKYLDDVFSPLKVYLSSEDVKKHTHLNTTIGSLAYRIICHKSGIPLEWEENPAKTESYSGGHHIKPRWEKVRGRIISADFISAYPHTFIQNNLYSHSCSCCGEDKKYKGNGVFELSGKYCVSRVGVIESTLKELLELRLETKKKIKQLKPTDSPELAQSLKRKDVSIKLLINSMYGISGNPIYKRLYNKDTASDCTYLVRSMLKMVAAVLEANDCFVMYGFTDSVYCVLPEYVTEEDFEEIIDDQLTEIKKTFPFPMDSFKMPIEKRLKFMWFVDKKVNKYLWIDEDNQIGYLSTLFDKNTPKVVMTIFESIIKPRILKTLDVKFTEDELERELKRLLTTNIELAGTKHNVKKASQYKRETQIQAQISKKYGSGTHFLIPNNAGVGVGRDKGTKTRKPKRYCTVADFKKEGLTVDDVCISHLMRRLKPFHSTTEDVKEYSNLEAENSNELD